MQVTPKQAAAFFRRAQTSLLTKARRAEVKSLEDARKTAVKLSSGTYSTRTLRRMGHPYARRRPRPPQDAAIINAQTGLFRLSWEALLPAYLGGSYQTSLRNLAPYSGYMRGTALMIARPVFDRVPEQTFARRYARLDTAAEQALLPAS